MESRALAPFACRSSESRGRAYEEGRHSRRIAFQRDRDRIVNCKSFRRLEYKTQVFVNGTADHYRTRLTHTIEMTSVARTLARALKVNEDLTAAISLAHDIGHSPFGHSGERALDQRMQSDGGFDHNIQSLRWVELLEEDYPEFNGLNLCWETRMGLRKHLSKTPGEQLEGFPIGPWQNLEAQVADVADDIAYQAHDAQDGLEAGLITLDQLRKFALWQTAEERVRTQYPNCPEDRLGSTTIRMLFTLQIEDVLNVARDRLGRWQPQHFTEIMNAPTRTLCFSDDMKALLKPYRDFLFNDMYNHPIVKNANDESVRLMERLFDHYTEHPEDMGQKAQRRIDAEGLLRTVCDYVAGCTDRYALQECHRHKLTN